MLNINCFWYFYGMRERTEEIENFLQKFNSKYENFGLVELNNAANNLQTKISLELQSNDLPTILNSLNSSNYLTGPIKEPQHFLTPSWVFRKKIKQLEVHIKLTLGIPDSPVVCIFFKIAEAAILYPINTCYEEKSVYRW